MDKTGTSAMFIGTFNGKTIACAAVEERANGGDPGRSPLNAIGSPP